MGPSIYHTTTCLPVRLQKYIDCFKIYHFIEDEIIHLFPEGHFDLILQGNSDILYRSASSEGWVKRPRQFIGGLHNQSYSLQPTSKHTQVLSIQFKPWCAKYFIPDKLHLYKNRIIDLADIFGRNHLGQLERTCEAAYSPMLFSKLEEFLASLFRDRPRSPIDEALLTLQQQQGFSRIDQLAQQSCLSKAQFRKRFREEIGMSPKEYSKIIRVNTILRYLTHASPSISFTKLTYQLGYFDQAHLIKDFQGVMGISPKRYLSGLR